MAFPCGYLSEPEIGHDRSDQTLRCRDEKDVGALEVAMDHARTVRGLQRRDHLLDERQGLRRHHALFPLQLLEERFAGEQLHGEEGDPVSTRCGV